MIQGQIIIIYFLNNYIMSFVNFNFVTDKSNPVGIGVQEPLGSGLGSGLGNSLGSSLGGSSKITIFGLAVLLVYSITKILNFYGIGIEVYGSYLAFYVFILLTSFVLDKYYPTL